MLALLVSNIYARQEMDRIIKSRDAVNEWMARFGVRFGVYKNGIFKEQLFPFDSIPRVITQKEWTYIEKGLIQRVNALNLFLYDIYHEKEIIKDNIIPPEFVFSSKEYIMATTSCEDYHKRLFREYKDK